VLLRSWPEAIKENEIYGETPLRFKVMYRASVEAVSLLASRWPGAVKEKDRRGLTPLYLAVENGASVKVVSLMLSRWPEAVKEKDRHVRALLHLDVENEASEDFKNLLSHVSRHDVVLLRIEKWPNTTKSLELRTHVMADFLCGRKRLQSENNVGN